MIKLFKKWVNMHFIIIEEMVSKNKMFEFQLSWMPNAYWRLSGSVDFDKERPIYLFFTIFGILEFSFCWSRCNHHAGVSLSMTIIGLFMNIAILDSRHWDYDNDCWEDYERIDYVD